MKKMKKTSQFNKYLNHLRFIKYQKFFFAKRTKPVLMDLPPIQLATFKNGAKSLFSFYEMIH